MLCGSGFYVAWYIGLQSIRNSQKAVLSHPSFSKIKVVKFVFSKDDLKNNSDVVFDEDDSNEFEYKKQMYDIISRHEVGDRIYITCISDTEEDNLRDFAMSQIMNSGNNTTGKELPIFKFRLDHFTHNFKNVFTVFSMNAIACSHHDYTVEKLITSYLNIPSPPPWA